VKDSDSKPTAEPRPWPWPRRQPASLRRRLWVVGLLGTVLVTVLATWLLGLAFERALQRGFEANLINEHAALVGLLEALPDGTVALRKRPADPRYERPFSGAYWQVDRGTEALRSRSLWDFDPGLRPPRSDGRLEILTADGPSSEDWVVVRQRITLPRSREAVVVWLAGDRAPLRQELAEFRLLVSAAIGALAMLFLAVLSVQVGHGLHPLKHLSESLQAVRRGDLQRLPTDNLPGEISPLALHLNELFDHQERSVRRARHAAADLAHGLKTSLAVLDAAAQRPDEGLPQVVREQTGRMLRVVRRQLNHGLHSDLNARCAVGPVAKELASLFAGLPRDPALALQVEVEVGLEFPGDRETLEEILGNLVDNAAKWARREVRIRAFGRSGQLVLMVDDDGPGLPEAKAQRVLDRGVRLDEQVPGSGLGLSIVQDLLEPLSGRLTLEGSDLGGLRVRIQVAAPS
jgi:signal transduction histidine kinase